MIEGIEIIAGGEDIAAEQQMALNSTTLTGIIGHRMGQIAKGHSQQVDDATSYRQMLDKVGLHFIQPIRDRTRDGATSHMLDAAAVAAEKLAAFCWALADKARRDAARQRAAEQAEQED